jgi:DNA polymerase III subunit gamma/tau
LEDNKYLVYTRKWRPQLFEDIIGQSQVTKPLQRAIELNRIMHAYLFSGPRGVGKTTTARVFAKALNCVNGPTVTPCNVCSSCVDITSGTDLDVIEIDGASNNGVDQVRELRERIGLSTARSRYKVYIIDEVHMLSTAAFNALLKTLEEPPKHVIFIFATTDPQDIPQTILSRCQHFRFKRMPVDLIVENLKIIASKEKIECEEKAYYTLAKAADGALRDGQRIFDQLVTYARGEKITDALASEMLGEIDSDILNGFLGAVVRKDIKSIMSVLETVFSRGYDLKHFLGGITESFRNMLLIKTVDDKSMVETSVEQYELLKKLSQAASRKEILYMLQKSLETDYNVAKSAMPGIVMEAYAADLIFYMGDGPVPEGLPEQPVIKKIEPVKIKPDIIQPEKSAEGIKSPVIETKSAKEEAPSDIAEDESTAKSMLIDEIQEEEEIAIITKDVIEKHWPTIIERIRTKKEDELATAMETAGIVSYDNQNLSITGENRFFTEKIKKQSGIIKEVLKEELKKDFNITIFEKSEYNARHQADRNVDLEEARNNPAVRELGKIFKFNSIEVKRSVK